MNRLGSTQKSVLNALKRHGGVWYAGCGWMWDTHSNTTSILETLAKRGLVIREVTKDGKTTYTLAPEL